MKEDQVDGEVKAYSMPMIFSKKSQYKITYQTMDKKKNYHRKIGKEQFIKKIKLKPNNRVSIKERYPKGSSVKKQAMIEKVDLA